MKKVLLSAAIALTALTAATTAKAQQGLSVSVKGIPQLSWLMNSDNNDDKTYERETAVKAAFGVGANYGFTKNMGVGLDVLYSMQGEKYKQAGIENNLKLSYIKIPLMFTYNTGIDSSKKIAFIGKIGPQLSILANSKGEVNGTELAGNLNDTYSSANFGAVALAGARFALSSNFTLDAGVRYDYEFTDAVDATPSGAAATNNMTLGLEVGLNYHIK